MNFEKIKLQLAAHNNNTTRQKINNTADNNNIIIISNPSNNHSNISSSSSNFISLSRSRNLKERQRAIKQLIKNAITQNVGRRSISNVFIPTKTLRYLVYGPFPDLDLYWYVGICDTVHVRVCLYGGNTTRTKYWTGHVSFWCYSFVIAVFTNRKANKQ